MTTLTELRYPQTNKRRFGGKVTRVLKRPGRPCVDKADTLTYFLSLSSKLKSFCCKCVRFGAMGLALWSKTAEKRMKMCTSSMVLTHSNINEKEMVALHAKSSTLGEAKMAGNELNKCERTSTSLAPKTP